MVSPFFALEAEEAVALELLDERVRLVLLVEFGLWGEDLSDEVGIGDGEPPRGAEPHKECCTCADKLIN